MQDNGDRLTGRILYVQFGILQLSSKHCGSVAIEWPPARTIINYDSRPPGESTKNLDYGFDVSLSYNFGCLIP